MKNIYQSFQSLDIIYYPGRQHLHVLPCGEVLTREQLLLLRTVLNGEQREQVSGSLRVHAQAEMLRMDWGHVCLEVGEETTRPLCQLLNELDLIEPEVLYFYEVEERPYGCFSNCSPYGIWMDGIWWQTVEHYFQAMKFLSPSLRERIRRFVSAKEAAKRGRDKSLPLRSDWEAVKDDIMLAAVQCKVALHPNIRRVLLETEEKKLIEAAPNDYYWGCGQDGSGQNKLGQILMKVRASLRECV